MRKARENRDLTLAVSLALTAGLFAAPQTACGAPVLDPNSTRNADQVVVKQSGAVTDITGRKAHNVIDWKDFSIGAGETVRFDQGAKEKDYLNLVTGNQQSTINGALKGGKDVYIVNPNGVVFGKGASVDVGNLYVSTTKATLDVSKYLASGASPLVNTAYQAAGAVTNLGKIAANRVEVEGGNIKFLNTADVTDSAGAINSNVKITTSIGKIQLGHEEGDTTTYTTLRVQNTAALKFGLRRVRGSNYVAPENYTTITTWSQLSNVKNNLSGNYWLGADLDGGNRAISALSGFSGTFDGNYGTISNFTVTASGDNGGLFGALTGKVCNLGIINETTTAKYAGGIAGQSDGATLEHVYVKNSTINGTYITSSRSTSGGLIGSAKNSTISESYASGNRVVFGGGLVGALQGGNTIKNVYSTGGSVASQAGLYYIQSGSNTITNAYTTFENIALQTLGSGTVLSGVTDSGDYQKAAHYNDWKDDKGNQAVSADGATNTVWRIYDGKTLPLLRAFLRANANGGTVSVNYNYTQGDNSGSVAGKDLSVVYNANNLKLNDLSFQPSSSATVDTSKIMMAGGVAVGSNTTNDGAASLHDANKYDAGDGSSQKDNKAYAASDGIQYFYTGQDGYDLVGGHIDITPRTVTITADSLTNGSAQKEYDGTNDATKAIQALFKGNASSSSGIIASDYYSDGSDGSTENLTGTAYVDTTGVTATFSDEKVGAHKAIALSGGPTLKNVAGKHNYVMSAASETLNGKTIYGNITQRALTVSLKNGTIEKVYDGTNALKNGTAPADYLTFDSTKIVTKTDSSKNSKADDVSLVVGSGSYDSKNAGSRTVTFSDIQLSGNDKGNYVLKDSNGNVLYDTVKNDIGSNVSNKSFATDQAKITPRKIGDLTLNQTTSREYDGTSDYAGTGTTQTLDVSKISMDTAKSTDTGIVSGDDVVITADGSGKFYQDDGKTKAKNAGEAKKIQYNVKVSGADIGNYSFDGSTALNSGATGTALGTGEITKRTIYISGGKGVDKAYDGNNSVLVDARKVDPTNTTDSPVVYTDQNDTKHHLVGNDTFSLDGSSTYEQAAVKYGADGKPAAQQITYHVFINQGGLDNYQFDSSGSSKISLTTDAAGKSITGIITPAIVSDLTFSDISKTYDTKADVLGAQDTDKIALESAKVSGTTVTAEALAKILNTAKTGDDGIQGTYGGITDGKFSANEHVICDSSGNVITDGKDVRYTNIQLLNTNYTFAQDADGNKISLTNGLAYGAPITATTAFGKGTIQPLAISNKKNLSLTKLHDITKTYDGDAKVKYDKDSSQASYYVGDLKARIDSTKGFDAENNTITIPYTVTDAVYADKNHGGNKGVTYTLKINYNQGAYTDYSIDSLLQNGTLTYDTGTGTPLTGTISQRVLKGIVQNTPSITAKEYDGTTAVVKTVGDTVSTPTSDDLVSIGGMGIVDSDKNTVTNASTAAYDAKDVGEGASRITYTFKLDGDDNGNYTFESPTENGYGKITPRNLTPTFDKLTKTFDNTDAVSKDGTKLTDLDPAQNYSLDRVVSGDTVTLSYDAAYRDVNAGEADDYVHYTNLKLAGDDAKNYQLASSVQTADDGSRYMDGAGAIKAAVVDAKDILAKFRTITKVYDGSDAVSYTHDADSYSGQEGGNGQPANSASDADYIQSISINGITLTSGKDYTFTPDSAVYNSKNVKDAVSAKYQFTLSDTMQKNFDFATNQQNLLDFTDSQSSGQKASYAAGVLTENPLASIQAKYVTAKLSGVSDVIEKKYDGNTKLVQADGTRAYDITNRVTFQGLLGTDGTTAKVSGQYQSKDVAYVDNDTSKDVTTQNVIYTPTLENNTYGNYQLVADTDGTALTNNQLIGVNQGKIDRRTLDLCVDKVTKTYDGTAALNTANKGAFNPTLTGLVSGESLTLNSDDITGTYGETQNSAAATDQDNFVEDGNVNGNEGAKAMRYVGLENALKNANGQSATVKASNYQIADAKYFNESADKGQITRLAIDASDIKEGWQPTVTKEYDGTKALEHPENYYGLYIDSANGVKLPSTIHFAYNLDASQANGKDIFNSSNVSDADSVTFHIRGLKDSGRLSNNFTMSGTFDFANYSRDVTLHNGDKLNANGNVVDENGNVISADGKKIIGKVDVNDTQTATVAITPRTVYAKAANANLTKTYDGKSAVENAVAPLILYAKTKDGTTSYLAGSDQDTSTGIYIDASGNETANATANPTNGAKQVKYTLGIQTADSKNYIVLDTDGNTLSSTASGGTLKTEGTILQKQLQLVLKDGTRLDKTYDGTSSLTQDALKNLQFSGLENGDKLTAAIGTNGLQGDYVTGSSETDQGAAQANVNWQNDDADDWGISISGAKNALANATPENGALSGNYTIGDTVYFQQAQHKGKILPLSLTMANLKENWSQVKKEYDGTRAVSNPEKYLSLSLQKLESNKISVGADGVTVSYALKKDGAKFAQKDAGKDLTVSYDVAGFDGVKNADGTENHNFSLAGIANTETTYQNTADGGRAADGLITPRVIAVKTVDGADWNKVYDGSAAVKDAKNKFVFTHAGGTQDSGLDDVLESDIEKGSVKSATVSAYYTKDGADDKNAGMAKKIRYTAAIDDGGKNNYTFVSVDDPANAVQTKSVSADDSGLTGDITKRTVYVDLDNPDGELVTKTYDGTADVTETNGGLSKWQSRVKAQDYDRAAQTGFVAGDDAALETGAVKVNFKDAAVARDNGRVTTKDAYFSNFQLDGKDSGNYELAVAPGKGTADGKLQATGKITPKAVQVSIKTTPTKEYDGTTALAPSQASIGNIVVDRSVLVGNDTLNVSLQSGKAPSYDNAHSNQTNGGKGIGVNYYLTWDNGNYELVHTASGSGDTQTVTTDGMNGTLRTESGIITPRALTIDSVADVTKVYDGTRDVDKTVISQTRDANGVYHDGDELNHSTAKITVGRVVNGDDVGFTAVGQYDDPYASSPDGQDDYKHDVTYKFAITNMDYQLKNSTGSGKGYITRRGLTVQAVPADIYAGQDMPTFTGSVTGWLTGETDGSGDFVFHAYTDTTDADGNTETSRLESARMPGKYAVYGTYNGSFSGNYGRNYHFEQAPANDTAFTINYIPDKPYRETINPSHHPVNGGGISVPRSQNTGTDFVKPAQANIAYPAKGGPAAVNLANSSDTVTPSAYRAYTQQRGTTIGTMEILNADVVNLDSSRRVDLDDSTAAMQRTDGSRVGSIEIKSSDNGATLTITNDFPDVFEADNNVSEKKAQAAVENASA